jgi:hypothetical protein
MARERCEGSGVVLSRDADTRFGNTICPTCKGIAQVDTTGDKLFAPVIEEHTVLVINFD